MDVVLSQCPTRHGDGPATFGLTRRLVLFLRRRHRSIAKSIFVVFEFVVRLRLLFNPATSPAHSCMQTAPRSQEFN